MSGALSTPSANAILIISHHSPEVAEVSKGNVAQRGADPRLMPE